MTKDHQRWARLNDVLEQALDPDGSVFLAESADGDFEQQAAIKSMRSIGFRNKTPAP